MNLLHVLQISYLLQMFQNTKHNHNCYLHHYTCMNMKNNLLLSGYDEKEMKQHFFLESEDNFDV